MLTLLTDAGHMPVWAVSSRSHVHNIPVYADIPGAPEGVQVVFIAVPDGHISRVADEINAAWGQSVKGIAFFHFSGLLTSDELAILSTAGAAIGSLHPLQSITDAAQARQILKGSIFTFEGMEGAAGVAADIVGSIGAVMMTIAPEHKVLYHTSAVFASNYLVALLHQASLIMDKIGMGLNHLMPLIKGTVSNIEEHDSKALTGPIARGDWATVDSHIQALRAYFPDLLPAYLEMGRYTAALAGRKFPEGLTRSPKFTGLDELCKALEAKRSRGMKVVFTNGCFDILHAGHVAYLNKARELGDSLVVGLNSDVSVRKLGKGPDRPVNNERSRAAVLSGLACVDHIVLFDEDTPLNLIGHILPHVLVKGGDWAADKIVGADLVKSLGGQVLTIPFEDGFSTTSIIEKIRKE
jgi:D-glycero-beta-D-manno-heptose 1-phosphate adenylyltransferase